MTGRGTGPRVLVDDMGRYTETIAHWVAKGHAAFLDPETGCQATIERQFEQLEEAAHRLGASFQKANPGIPWAPMFELRNEFSHPYEYGYDRERLWIFVRDQLPAIARKLRRPKFPGSTDLRRE